MKKDLGITIILVSHSMEDVAEYVDRIIVMNLSLIHISGQTQGAQPQPTDPNAAGQAQGTQTQQPAGQAPVSYTHLYDQFYLYTACTRRNHQYVCSSIYTSVNVYDF